MDFAGKKAVVTGASSGIGRGIAEELAERGAVVVAASRSAGVVEFASDRIIPVSVDLRGAEGVDRLLEQAAERLGGVDLFVADAGFGYYGKTPADWARMEDIFRLNVFSPVYSLARLCALFPGRPLRFVIMDSGAGRIPLPGYALYCSTKFALDGFARAFRFELPANVGLSVVFPVSVDTAFFDKAAGDAPPPRPVRPLRATVARIVRGIEEEREEIYPSRVFPLLSAVNRFCPPIEKAYQKSENNRFGDWLRSHGGCA